MGVRSKEMRVSLSLLCTQTQENPLPIHAVDPDTTSAGDGWWWPESRRTARKEPPFCSMRRAGAALPPPSSSSYGARLPTRRDQRGIPMAGSGRGLILVGGREGERSHGRITGGKWGAGLHDDTRARRRGGLFSPSLIISRRVGVGLGWQLWRFWLGGCRWGWRPRLALSAGGR